MKEIEVFEIAIRNNCKRLKAVGINPTMFWAYRNSKAAENELLDFHEVIWENDIPEIVDICEEYKITEFTISCTFSSLIKTIAEFARDGWQVAGVTQVKATYTDYATGKNAVIPALKMERALKGGE